jgi:23S rRNA pseudouridine1911/1915/1917 synthase
VFKPPGLLTQAGVGGEPSAMDLVKDWLREKYRKKGNVFLGLLHRLDRPVSGVLLFAKTSKGASRLSAQIRARTIRKTYMAAVEGTVSAAAAKLVHYFSSQDGRITVHDRPGPGRKRAELAYNTIRPLGRHTLLQVSLVTGRKHQIRAQLAHVGHPILGDRRYGSTVPWPHGGIGLVSVSLDFEHPVRAGERVVVNVPESLLKFDQ